MSKLTLRSDTADVLALELEHGTRWQGDKIGGAPVPGIGTMERGILPEPYWTAAEDAVYAVYHHETPIIWKVANGTWYVPEHRYSQTTSTFRGKLVAALEKIGADYELI